ncbi:hypothetical protein Mal4_38600 [Maioricimonas rarisocia]|uniref:Uncharacterized protein n=1 Tax=Maioricimonas rarisocia TaxID=2528026 RepID=A0A517ZAJ5_9PLAN|nr:hypothetical protein [Maioricimonas rarisocia]QDU39515.1 hypothetical protein Mal4_38600 [Maioricimonas rarisocia]
MSSHQAEDVAAIRWDPQPAAAALVSGLLKEFLATSDWISHFAGRLRDETGTRIVDWVDHIVVADGNVTTRLEAAGFVLDQSNGGTLWRNDRGMFPPVVVRGGGPSQLFLKVESAADFLHANDLAGSSLIDGDPLAAVRRARVDVREGSECWVIARHGSRGFGPETIEPDRVNAVVRHAEALKLRQRHFETMQEGFEHARRLIARAIDDLGVARTCDLFFRAEREYWQSRNAAARIQKARQDRLGLGWANHDHHTYRSSREAFTDLVAVLEQLGFVCRERFYAGETAGWGAQVLEQPDCGIVIFADVDLAPDEVLEDFSHEPLAPWAELGTVGLWCRLHGEAFLEAGMHHLECQFDFDAARAQLRELGVETMQPFTDLPYLRQAFTRGEKWRVAPERIQRLLDEGLIPSESAEQFRRSGALGSHLEILQRDDGYKGFNQSGIDEIILKTDPRRESSD